MWQWNPLRPILLDKNYKDFQNNPIFPLNAKITTQKSVYKYIIYLIYLRMVKTLRIETDALHKELLKIQGQIQAKTGEFTSMDDVIAELVRIYRKKK